MRKAQVVKELKLPQGNLTDLLQKRKVENNINNMKEK